MTSPLPVLLPGSLTEVPATAGARWLAPDGVPRYAEPWFRAGPPAGKYPVLVTRYADVAAILAAPDGTWLRHVPESQVPRPRHPVLDASWLLDGPEHRTLWQQLTVVYRGSGPAARQFTRDLTAVLAAEMMTQPPPWNLATVIDEVSCRVMIEHTLAAPVLLPHLVRLRELTRAMAPPPPDDEADVMACFRPPERQPDLEVILGEVARAAAVLPAGLARHLAQLARAGHLTGEQLISQLAMLIASAESQAAAASGAIAMLMAGGLLGDAQRAAGDPEGMRQLTAGGLRRAISFPFLMLSPAGPQQTGGRDIEAGEPVLVSLAAANADPAAYSPGTPPLPHLSFGRGPRRCQGAVQAEQFMADVITGLAGLPATVRLGHDGQVRREVTGVSWAIAEFPAVPELRELGTGDARRRGSDPAFARIPALPAAGSSRRSGRGRHRVRTSDLCLVVAAL